MAGRPRKPTELSEIKKLDAVFAGIPADKHKVVDGLIVQAARMRVILDELAADIRENGTTELFQQSEKVEPFTRERPQAALFIKVDKNYLAIIKQLVELCPGTGEELDELADFKSGAGR